VPGDDVDTYPMEVEDNLQLGCGGSVEIVLRAPPGIVLSLDVIAHDGAVVEHATSSAATPAVVVLGEAECGGDDKMTLDVVVRAAGGERVSADYELTRTGDF
jgi:hypothetical protein